jgi:prophage regulatory protein
MSTVRILRLAEVLAATGLSRSSLYDAIAKGEFPRQRQLTERAVGWRSDEVEAWIRERPRVSGTSA